MERKSEVGGKEGAQDKTEAQRAADKFIARVTNHMGLDSGNEGDDNDLQESSDYWFLTQPKTGQQPPKYRLPTRQCLSDRRGLRQLCQSNRCLAPGGVIVARHGFRREIKRYLELAGIGF